MAATRFRTENYNEYHTFLAGLGEDNSRGLGALRKNLRRAVREELTDRQAQMLALYYVEGQSMCEIADALAVNVSTVSRTIRRGRERLQRCLRYGAATLLK